MMAPKPEASVTESGEFPVVSSVLADTLVAREHPFAVDWQTPALELPLEERLLRLARLKALLPAESAEKEKTNHDVTLENYIKLALDAAGDRKTLDVFLNSVQQTLESDMPLAGRQMLAQQVFWIWLPVATIADLRDHKAELGDTALKVLLPDDYAALEADFAAIESSDNEATVQQTSQEISELVDSLDIDPNSFRVELSSRVKTKYSAWRKKHKEGRTETEIFDLLGFRLIVYGRDEKRNIGQCKFLMGALEDYFESTDRHKNYIDHPKANGYRGLHQTFRLPSGMSFEVQIRTYAIHKEASGGTGVAHHGYDATYKAVPGKVRRAFRKVPGLYSWRDWAMLKIAEQDGRTEGILGDDILFFRNDGNLYKLPKDSTALDASFRVHNRRALKTNTIYRNGRPIKFTSVIQHGDVIGVKYDAAYPTDAMRLHNMREITRSEYATHTIEKRLRMLGAPVLRKAGAMLVTDLVHEKLDLKDPLDRLDENEKQQLAARAGMPNFDKLLEIIGAGQKNAKPSRIARLIFEKAGLQSEAPEPDAAPPRVLADEQVLAGIIVPGSIDCRVAGCCSGKINRTDQVVARASRRLQALQLHKSDCGNLERDVRAFPCSWSEDTGR